jgi:hypothetical protein
MTFSFSVMAGLVPAIHVLGAAKKEGVDARVKPGHEERFGPTQLPEQPAPAIRREEVKPWQTCV